MRGGKRKRQPPLAWRPGPGETRVTRNRAETCSICLEVGADCKGRGCRAGHWFHPHCLEEWSQTTTECPVCKEHITHAVTRHGYTMRRFEKRARRLEEDEDEGEAEDQLAEDEWDMFQRMMHAICNEDSYFSRNHFDVR